MLPLVFCAAVVLGLVVAATPLAADPNMVLTPGGYQPRTNVHFVPKDGGIAHIGADVHVLGKNGSVIKVVATTKQRQKTEPTPRPSNGTTPALSGWITFASWLDDTGTPISLFEATWSVPPPPPIFNGQTVFLFIALEPGTMDAVLQPVLQYGRSAAGGGAFWSIATWYVVGDEQVFVTPLVGVDPGTRLVGAIEALPPFEAGPFSYTAGFDAPGSSMTLSNVPELRWAAITLEAYNIVGRISYPPGETVFENTKVQLVEGVIDSVPWAIMDDAAEGITTRVLNSSSSSGEIVITY